jgi:prolyl oligopeptidase
MIEYPPSRKGDVVDRYHGVDVPDPYRWLEDPDSPETRAWVEAQNDLCRRQLERIPERGSIRERIALLWDHERYGTVDYPVPIQRGGRYFYFRNDGLQNQPVLWYREGLDGDPVKLLDPNGLCTDGTLAVASLDVSADGRRLAYALAAGGSDWQEIRVRDVDTGADLPDVVRRVKFSAPSWTRDSSGFYYSRYPETADGGHLLEANRNQKLCYHRLGTSQDQDVLVYERPDRPEWGFRADVSEDGRYVFVHVWHGTAPENRVYFQDLTDPYDPHVTGPVRPLLDEGDASYVVVGNVGPRLYLVTDRSAPRKRVVSLDVRDGVGEHQSEIIPEDADVLESARLLGGGFVLVYLRNASASVRIHALDGHALEELDLPGPCSVAGLSGRQESQELFLAFASFLRPSTVLRHDLQAGTTETFAEPELRFDAGTYVTTQVVYPSRDGTPVPMFVTSRRDVELDGSNPVMLYGYGGFNISLTPFFSVPHAVWLDMGGILAVPNLRGGGEFGEDWHRAGILDRKQSVFDDFIAAAEFLVEEGYTEPRRIAISGGSNGGLLVGACMIQRPDLFQVALPAVGVMDMLRFHHFTIGWAWVSDYGSSEDAAEFGVLRAYSPLHNLREEVCYPATLVTTADHDDRVVPGHSFKFAARLQEAQGCSRPVLIRVDVRAGHGAGKPTGKLIDEAADRWAFAWRHLTLADE